MAVFSLLYASVSTIPEHRAEAEIEKLVEVSRVRNHALGISGCLLFAGGRFAQALEGDRDAVTALMTRIVHDPRHLDVTILEEGELSARRFGDWSLDYAGPSFFVQRTISRPAAEAMRGSRRGVSHLLEVMTGFREAQAAIPPLMV